MIIARLCCVASFIVASTLFTPGLTAQKTAESLKDKEVITVNWNSEFKLLEKVVDQVDLGRLFHVEEVKGNWLRVNGKSGWIHVNNVVPKEKAEFHFSIELKQKPGAPAYHHRGLVLTSLEKYDQAIADFDEAIKLQPDEAPFYNSRGKAYHRKKDFEKALADYQKAIELNAKYAIAHNNRAILLRDMGRYEEALKDHELAIKFSPLFPEAYNGRAWLMSSCPDKKFQNGKSAVEDAKRACQLTNWNDDVMLGTLAAAYARVGDFQQAERWLNSAVTVNPYRFVDERAEMKKQFAAKKPFEFTAGGQ
jgi:Tfp pilus assembly protein PilF